MKLSEILVKYAIETPQNKVTTKTAEQFLKSQGIENVKLPVKNDSK